MRRRELGRPRLPLLSFCGKRHCFAGTLDCSAYLTTSRWRYTLRVESSLLDDSTHRSWMIQLGTKTLVNNEKIQKIR